MPNYTVQSGDTLSAIARRNGLTLAQLLAQNPQFAANPNVIRPGQTVILTGTSEKSGTSNSQPYTDQQYADALANHPVVQSSGNSAAAVEQAALTGDFSGLINSNGQPFTTQQQQDALSKGMNDNSLFYAAQNQKDTTDTTNSLAQKQADYNNYLQTSGANFQKDRANLNQQAVNNGVLFSGGNAQRQRKLQSSYEQDQAYKQGTMGRDIASTAQNYQYNYGNNAANGLSQYYGFGGNTYGLGTATGTVGSQGLSTVYNPNNYNYQGTQNTAQQANAQQRAAGYLTNQGNKLLSTGYGNKL